MSLRTLNITWMALLPFFLLSQVERESLYLQGAESQISELLEDSTINLRRTRELSTYFTSPSLPGEAVGSNAKKAVQRHVRYLSEELETAFLEKRLVDSSIIEILMELKLLYRTSIQKEKDERRGVTFLDKVRMQRHTSKSLRTLQYPISSEIRNATDWQEEPTDSPFWHAVPDSISPHKMFGRLAEAKKIDADKRMVVVFDKVSTSGSAPKIHVKDLDLDNAWTLKWGDEVHTDVVGSRIFAALGYDVDHPYAYDKNKVMLIFQDTSMSRSSGMLISAIKEQYDINLWHFISSVGVVTADMVRKNPDLGPYEGLAYMRFRKCALEARPDRVKRLGPILSDEFSAKNRRELRGALLAHMFIGNWDTREENTMISTVHLGDHRYRVSAAFNDLGTSFGVVRSLRPVDFKAGLVNHFGWEVIDTSGGRIRFTDPINSILSPYQQAEYADLKWMASKIAGLDSTMLWKMVKKARWPDPIAQLYFHKLASRRANILSAFGLPDPHPIPFDRKLTVQERGKPIIAEGVLLEEYKPNKNPEGFLDTSGRFTNYGNDVR